MKQYQSFYHENKTEISLDNLKKVRLVSFIVAVVQIVIIAMAPFLARSEAQLIHALIVLVLGGIVFFSIHLIAKAIIVRSYINHKTSRILTLVMILIFYIYTIYLNIFIAPNLAGLFFVVFNVIASTTYIISYKDTLIGLILAAIIFAVLSYLVKELNVFKMDLFFAFGSLVIGIPYNYIIYRLKMQDMYLSQFYLRQAHTDILTAMPNRRHFYENFIERANNKENIEKTIALAVLDIDNFKLYNDKYSHFVGDEVIKLAARILVENSNKKNMYIARYGGDEFVVTVSNLTKQEIKGLFNSIILKMNSIDLTSLGINDLTLSFSIGICFAKDPAIVIRKKMLETADKALYYAKNKGKNCSIIIDYSNSD